MSNVKLSNTWTMEEVHKKKEIDIMRFTHIYINLMSHMMLTKNPQNVHRKYFWAILITFIWDVKIDINMCEPHYVYLFFLWTSSIVQVFDYLAIDIFLTINLFEDQHTLPKWNILSQSCYCCLFYVLAFQDQHTLPKWNILSQSEYIEQATITAFHRIFHFGRVCWSWKANT